MTALRFLTLIWPGLPWLWLRGSLSGLALAVAFAVAVDIAIVVTWIWPGLVELPLTIGLWTAVAALWLVATVSAVSGFPPAIPAGRGAEADALFAKARDLYLSRDWLQAESRLRELLDRSPTDGEAQLLLGTLFRRTGRAAECRRALEKLARSDSGGPWQTAIATELSRLAADDRDADDSAVVLPIHDESAGARSRTAAA